MLGDGQRSSSSNEGEGNKRPLRYFQNLRNNIGLSYRSSPGSQIIEVQEPPPYRLPLDGVENEEESSSQPQDPIRLMHLAQIMPLVADSAFFLYLDAPGLLAVKHFNERSNVVVPNLSELLGGCNIYLTMDMLDSKLDPVVASSKLYSYFQGRKQQMQIDESGSSILTSTSASPLGLLQKPQPAGVVGAVLSRISSPLSVLTGTYEIPQISPASTAGNLENPDLAPTFGRTIPTNAGQAEASVAYFESLGVSHFAILHVRDSYGNSFQQDLAKAVAKRGGKITHTSIAYDDGDIQSVRRSLEILKRSGLRYIFSILRLSNFEIVLEEAYDAGVVGDGYTWYIPEIDEILAPGYSLDRAKKAKLAAAIQGSQVVNVEISNHPAFEREISALQTDVDFQSFFLESHRGDDTPAYDNLDLSNTAPMISAFTYTAYDAAMALGLAACQSEEYFSTGPGLFEQFKQTTFEGASGPVAFDLVTGTRKFDTLAYSFTNVFIDKARSTNDTVVFKSRLSTLVDFSSENGEKIQEVALTIYADGTSNPPSSLPPFEENLNLVSKGVFAIGWMLSGGIILTCLWLGWWVYKHRKNHVVRSSQPLFLGMLLVGTLVMASSIIPMTFQEPTSQKGLDFACMITPWLFLLGFSTAFSAIFTKAWRIYMVVHQAINLQRTTINASDVLLPLLMLMVTNVLLLASWTVESPLVWTRVPVNNLDTFGRSVESYGVCKARVDDGESISWLFITFLGIINFAVVAFAFYQSILTRNLPSHFNDARHVTLCMGILMETFFLGIPTLFVVGSNPTAKFLVQTLLVAFTCLATLGPNFAPKFSMRRQQATPSKGDMMRDWSEVVANSHRTPSTLGVMYDSSRGMRHQSASFRENDPSAMPSSVAQLRASIARRQSLPSSVAELQASAALSTSPARPVDERSLLPQSILASMDISDDSDDYEGISKTY